MEITKTAEFVTDVYGGKPYLSGMEVIKNWLEAQQDRLLHPRMKKLKDAMGNESKLEEILKVFNVNGGSEPVIGDWMLRECSMDAAKLVGTWSRFEVTADAWQNSVRFSPPTVQFVRNGEVIAEPDQVECGQTTTKRKKPVVSFFWASQVIRAGAQINFTIHSPDDLCIKVEGKGKGKQIVPDVEKTQRCVEAVLDKMCIIGLGAYRLRYGKFRYI